MLIAALSLIGHDLLIQAAIAAGVINPAAGIIVLAFVVLLKLVTLVLMFAVLRPHLPGLMALREEPSEEGATKRRGALNRLLAVTAAAILPFFAYYAAWGFLGDTVREYSRTALGLVQSGQNVDVFALVQSRGVILAIVLCWLVRFLAKRMNKASGHPFWRLLVVAADASWIFIGLYALDIWKDEFIRWLGAGVLLGNAVLDFLAPIGTAYAEGFLPSSFSPVPGAGNCRTFSSMSSCP